MKKSVSIIHSFRTAIPAAAILLTSAVCAQVTAPLRFIPDQLDFGMIREDDGKVSRKLQAVNTSQDTTFIISARTSCGCSEVDYDKSPIAPGDTTEISVTYDATNRPGNFLKTIKLFTGTERIPNTCKVKGLVIPSREHLDRSYPEKAGNLRLTTLLVNAGEMLENVTRPIFIGIYNDSDTPYALKGSSDSDALSVAIMPDTIEPQSISTATLVLKTRDIKGENFNINTYITDAETGKLLVKIPVGGTIRRESAIKQ